MIQIDTLNNKIDKSKGHFGHYLLYEFQLKRTTAQAHRNLVAVFSNERLSERQCRIHFEQFRNGDFSIEDAPHVRQPIQLDIDVTSPF